MSPTKKRMGTPSPQANSAPPPTVEDVVAWIRHEVSLRQASLPPFQPDMKLVQGETLMAQAVPLPGSLAAGAPHVRATSAGSPSKHFSPAHEAQWQRIRDNLNLAEQHALAGALVPELGRFRGVTRKIAKLAARGLLYLGKVFTNPQRKFNVAILGTLRDLHYLLRQWDQTKGERLEQEHRILADLREGFAKLEQDHAELKAQFLASARLTSRTLEDPGECEREKRAA